MCIFLIAGEANLLFFFFDFNFLGFVNLFWVKVKRNIFLEV